MNRRGFTLIEMLIATMLAALLMTAVLQILGGIARDRRRLTTINASTRPQALIERIRWDLTNARSMTQSPDGRALVLVGHGSIDPQTLLPTGRLVRVTYRCVGSDQAACLEREQVYLDSAVPARPWNELVAPGVSQFAVVSADAESVSSQVTPIPPRLRLHVELKRTAWDEELCLR